MLAIYWDTVARWSMMRARRDATTLGEELYILQAADECAPPMPRDLAAKLLSKARLLETGAVHGMLPLHIGMHVRFFEHLD